MTNDQPVNDTPRNVIKAMRIFCAAMMGGCILFMIIVLGLTLQGAFKPAIGPEIVKVLLAVLSGIGAVCLVIGVRNYNKSITSAKDSLITLADKLDIYRKTLITYLAMCEMPALFGIIVFFISGNYLSLIVTGVMLIAMLAKFPTASRVSNDLELGSQERQELE